MTFPQITKPIWLSIASTPLILTLLKEKNMHLSLSSLAIIGLSSTLVLSAPIPQIDDGRPFNPAIRRLQSEQANLVVGARPIPPALVGAPPRGLERAQIGLFVGPPVDLGPDTPPRSAGSRSRDQESPRRVRPNTPPSPMGRVAPDVYPFTQSAVLAANPHLRPQQATQGQAAILAPSRGGSSRLGSSRLGDPNLMASHHALSAGVPLPELPDFEMRDAHAHTGRQDQGEFRDSRRTARAIQRADAEEAARVARDARAAARAAQEEAAHRTGNVVARILHNLHP